MPYRNIGSYLNHHLAASVAWLDAVERLEQAEQGTPTGRALSELKVEAVADRQVLEEIMARLRVTPRETEKATAWLGEKLSRLMLPLGEGKDRRLTLLLMLEGLSLGIEGRRSLWIALAAAAPEVPSLMGQDFETLIRRAEAQRARLEALRLDAAQLALVPET